jgi:hypothetical protein
MDSQLAAGRGAVTPPRTSPTSQIETASLWEACEQLAGALMLRTSTGGSTPATSPRLLRHDEPGVCARSEVASPDCCK